MPKNCQHFPSKREIVLVTTGDPAGIGPDICLSLYCEQTLRSKCYIVLLGDIDILRSRAKMLRLDIKFNLVNTNSIASNYCDNSLNVLHINHANAKNVIPGILNVDNVSYILNTLDVAIDLCKSGVSNIIVTAPVSKEIINIANVEFTGHTEYFAKAFNCDKVVMMLCNNIMKIALLTTHIPLKDVHLHITFEHMNHVLDIIHNYFTQTLGIRNPKIAVCGLNPHAGDGGYIGLEEINIINPVIKHRQSLKEQVFGSFSADTMFLSYKEYDVFLAMYHDQGLPVLKYSGFEDGINVTMGLPIIRTSVDHGVALNLAGSGKASNRSLINAIEFALNISNH